MSPPKIVWQNKGNKYMAYDRALDMVLVIVNIKKKIPILERAHSLEWKIEYIALNI